MEWYNPRTLWQPSVSWLYLWSFPITFKTHVIKLKESLSARSALLCKLSTSCWGANPATIRSTALTLCFSAAEYACAVWERSAHAKKIDPVLNTRCRSITGCMKPTKTDDIHSLRHPPPRCKNGGCIQKKNFSGRWKMKDNPFILQRLRSRRSFLATVFTLKSIVSTECMKLCDDRLRESE